MEIHPEMYIFKYREESTYSGRCEYPCPLHNQTLFQNTLSKRA